MPPLLPNLGVTDKAWRSFGSEECQKGDGSNIDGKRAIIGIKVRVISLFLIASNLLRTFVPSLFCIVETGRLGKLFRASWKICLWRLYATSLRVIPRARGLCLHCENAMQHIPLFLDQISRVTNFLPLSSSSVLFHPTLLV